MSDRFPDEEECVDRELCEKVGIKAARKLRAQREQRETVWFGLGMMGLVGWSVAIPMLIGLAIGVWIDRRWPSQYSWTLMLLFVGIALGCLNAWRWLSRERERIERREETGDD